MFDTVTSMIEVGNSLQGRAITMEMCKYRCGFLCSIRPHQPLEKKSGDHDEQRR